MTEGFGFKDLKVWHKAIDFAVHVNESIANLDSDRKHFRLVEQLEACAASISANIAEGKGRSTNKDFQKFLFYSRASAYEAVSFLNLFHKKGWISLDKLTELEKEALELVKMIIGLINSLN